MAPGFVGPTVLLAQTLVRRGHDVVVVSGRTVRAAVEEQGVPFSDGGVTNSTLFETRMWFDQEANLAQCVALRRVIREGADLLVGHNLSPAAYAIAEICQLPLAVIGHAAWLWPVASTWTPSSSCASGDRPKDRAWRYRQFLNTCNRLREQFRLPPITEESGNLVVGDLHLLRTIPELETLHPWLPPGVHLVGPLQSPATPPDAGLARWLEAARDVPVVYMQLGPQFGERDAFRLLEPLFGDGRLRAVMDVGRFDMDDRAPFEHASVYFSDRVSMDQILPRATSCILSGHPAGVLGSLSHGLPMLLLPNGSGTEVLAARCAEAGVAAVVPEREATPELVAARWAEMTSSAVLRRRAQSFAERFAQESPAERGADLLEALVARRRSQAA